MNDSVKTDILPLSRRLPAEWETHDCVLIAWPHELPDWNYMLDEARDCFANIVRAISEEECVLIAGPADLCLPSIRRYEFDARRVKFMDIPTNDTWARDFGGLTIELENGTKKVLDFKFNGWGLKFASNLDNLITLGLEKAKSFNAPLENHLSFVLEGGSVESDGQGTLLTTSECLLSPNRNGAMTQEQIDEYLCDAFGFNHTLWLDHGALAGDDTDSHIDTLARLAPGDTIIYVGAPDEENMDKDPNTDSLQRMRDQLSTFRTKEGNPFNLVELPSPAPIYDEDGQQLPATYANFLISPRRIYLPVYSQPRKDLLAQQILRIAFPDHEVVPIDCRALIQQHGSLHCVTMQFPAGTIAGIDNGNWIEPDNNIKN